MSDDNTVYVDLDLKLKNGHEYRGNFVLKKYLNQRDRNDVARISNKLSVGMRRPASYSINVLYDLAKSSVKNSLSKIYQDQKVSTKYADSLNPDTIAAGVLEAILPEIRDIDPRAEEMYYLALLNVHVLEAPEWWKPKGEDIGGLTLKDYEPIADLYLKLMEAQKPVVEESPITKKE